MRSLLLLSVALLLVGAAPPKKKLLTPTDVVNDAPKSAWKTIPADDLVVMDLANGSRVVMQVATQFAPVTQRHFIGPPAGSGQRGTSEAWLATHRFDRERLVRDELAIAGDGQHVVV